MIIGNERLRSQVLEDAPPILLDGHKLNIVDVAKNLGIYIDSKWSFTQHVYKKCGAAFMRLKALFSFRKILPSSVKLKLAESLVLSQLDYGSAIYFPCLTKQFQSRIQKIQNSCLRFAYGIRKFDHISPAFAASAWLPMKDRITVHYSCLVHGVVTCGSPKYLRDKIHFLMDLHVRNSLMLRSRNTLSVPKHRTVKFMGSFSYCAALYYNSVPDELKQKSIPVLRRALKEIKRRNPGP
jgi:hypothetical protein